jgi:hypothetical protein
LWSHPSATNTKVAHACLSPQTISRKTLECGREWSLELSDYLEEGLRETDIRDMSNFKYLNKILGVTVYSYFSNDKLNTEKGFQTKEQKID